MTHHRAMRLPALLLPALLLPAVILLVPSAAHAEKVVTHDAAGDAGVVGWLAEEDAELPPVTDPSPADVVRTVAAHGETRLSIAVHFLDLAGVREHSTRFLVRTPAGSFSLDVRAKGRRTRTTLTQRDHQVDCRALRARFDAAADVVAVSVPTACLSSPRWVRLGVTAFAPLPVTDPAVLASTVDDGHRDTLRLSSVGTGPRIRRG
jgi:hypothetical protein